MAVHLTPDEWKAVAGDLESSIGLLLEDAERGGYGYGDIEHLTYLAIAYGAIEGQLRHRATQLLRARTEHDRFLIDWEPDPSGVLHRKQEGIPE
jgi:hypothetical protein